MIGAVEAGGTKFRAAIMGDDLSVLREERFPTTDPVETLSAVVAFLASAGDEMDAVGIACFGPVDLRPSSTTYGTMLSTPKPGWAGAPILGTIRDGLDLPTVIDSDVGAAVLGEATRGAGRGRDTVTYVTVGTGIGGATAAKGVVQRGHGHSEYGHIPISRADGDAFAGVCPYHGDCLEGMASGAAIQRREESGESEPYDLVAVYLGQLVQTLTYTVAPEVISFGGGVFGHPGLIEAVREAAIERLARYATDPAVYERIDDYVVRSPLDQDAGLLGAGLLALTARS